MSEKKYYIDQHAVVDDNVEIGEGTKIWYFSMFNMEQKLAKSALLDKM